MRLVAGLVTLLLIIAAGVGVFLEYTAAWLIGEQARFDFGPEHVCIGAAIFVLFQGLALWLGQRPEPRLADYGAVLKLWTLRFATP